MAPPLSSIDFRIWDKNLGGTHRQTDTQTDKHTDGRTGLYIEEPAYLLFLDAKSAFDRVLPELLVRSLYLAGMNGNSTVFVMNRLTNRKTFLDWDKNLMGPIKDELGLEQGDQTQVNIIKVTVMKT